MIRPFIHCTRFFPHPPFSQNLIIGFRPLSIAVPSQSKAMGLFQGSRKYQPNVVQQVLCVSTPHMWSHHPSERVPFPSLPLFYLFTPRLQIPLSTNWTLLFGGLDGCATTFFFLLRGGRDPPCFLSLLLRGPDCLPSGLLPSLFFPFPSLSV